MDGPGLRSVKYRLCGCRVADSSQRIRSRVHDDSG